MRNGASASCVTTQGDTVVAKFLPRNGPSGWYSQRLHVARRPVVKQAEAENVLRRLADRHGLAEFGRRADIQAELELEIEIARRTVARHRLVRAACAGPCGRFTGVPLTRTDEARP